MEFNSATAITAANHRETPKKKRRGLGRFFRIALYMLKHSKSHKKNVPNFKSHSLWKIFIHSIRPLCAQNHRPPPRLTVAVVAGVSPNEDVETFTPPMSQYASALNLQELDREPTAEILDDVFGGIDGDREGDDMIDAKAEQFIAQFYREIQVQNQVYNN